MIARRRFSRRPAPVETPEATLRSRRFLTQWPNGLMNSSTTRPNAPQRGQRLHERDGIFRVSVGARPHRSLLLRHRSLPTPLRSAKQAGLICGDKWVTILSVAFPTAQLCPLSDRIWQRRYQKPPTQPKYLQNSSVQGHMASKTFSKASHGSRIIGSLAISAKVSRVRCPPPRHATGPLCQLRARPIMQENVWLH